MQVRIYLSIISALYVQHYDVKSKKTLFGKPYDNRIYKQIISILALVKRNGHEMLDSMWVGSQ